MVFEIEPSLKRQFHAELVREGRTGKEWLLERIYEYLAERQARLPFMEEQ